jgi:hypothetical protein
MAPLKRPDITPAQIVAGVPVIADLGHAFNIWNFTASQQHAVTKAILYACVLMGADAAIRLGRSLGIGRK